MDYKKKYYEAQKWIESIYSELSHEQQMEAEAFFPELKESEDEKIRKWLIAQLKIKIGDNIILNNMIYKALDWLEKQGEQKPADKVEPKFNQGDWVIDKQGIVHQIANVIENVTNHTYGYDIVGGGYFNDNTEGVKLWTIQDAKDGDVLVASDDSIFIYAGSTDRHAQFYIALSKYGGFNTKGGNWEDKNRIKPATKEQRDTLIKAMTDAGYTFDFEKKELKKISQRMVSAEAKEALYDKPAWSDDE